MEDKSLFIEFMGDSPMIRVFDYLMTESDVDFSISDMARNFRIGRTTLYRIWETLVEKKIIVPTRVIGKAKLFKLNSGNGAVKKLMEIENALVLEDLKKRAGEGGINVKSDSVRSVV